MIGRAYSSAGRLTRFQTLHSRPKVFFESFHHVNQPINGWPPFISILKVRVLCNGYNFVPIIRIRFPLKLCADLSFNGFFLFFKLGKEVPSPRLEF